MDQKMMLSNMSSKCKKDNAEEMVNGKVNRMMMLMKKNAKRYVILQRNALLMSYLILDAISIMMLKISKEMELKMLNVG